MLSLKGALDYPRVPTALSNAGLIRPWSGEEEKSQTVGNSGSPHTT